MLDGGVDDGGVLDGGVDVGGSLDGGVLDGGVDDGGVLDGGVEDGGVDVGGSVVVVPPLLPQGPWLRLKLPTVVPSGKTTDAPVTVTPSPRWAVVR